MSGVSVEQLQRATEAAKHRRDEGYFGRAAAGDQKAASLFARLVALDLNPEGSTIGYGWLSKSPGEEQVEGYSEDAICYSSDPSNLHNVVDLVVGTGAPGAHIPESYDTKERRTNNKWVKPKPLTDEEMDYLLDGGIPVPIPPPSTIPSYEAMGGDEGGKKVTRLMEKDYKKAEKPGLDGDSGAWQWRTAYDFISGKFKTVEESIADHQPEWRQSLNDERVSQGKPPITW